jgi:hypothetical protein
MRATLGHVINILPRVKTFVVSWPAAAGCDKKIWRKNKHMSCFPDLTWPSCNPDEAKGIYQCSEAPSSVDCCLSAQTSDKGTSNCPAGWISHPDQDEWCTDSQGIIHDSLYRHKCKRVTCDNSRLDPKTNCQTCLKPLHKAPDCNACIHENLVFPECKACANDKRAPPECDRCLDPSETVCGYFGVCVDTNYDEDNCGACAGQVGSHVCGASEICDKGECVCGVKFDILAVQAVFEPRFTLILKWTSPKPLAELEGQTIQVNRDGVQNTFIPVSAGNTTLAARVFTTVLDLEAPLQTPAFYEITLFQQLPGRDRKSTQLRVDFPDYQNNNRTCGGPDTACSPIKMCVNGECKCPPGLPETVCSACSNGKSFFSDCTRPVSCPTPLENVSTNCQTCNNPRMIKNTGCTACTNENALASLNCTRFVFYNNAYGENVGITKTLFASQKTYGSNPVEPYMQVSGTGLIYKAGITSNMQQTFNRVAGSYDGSRLLGITRTTSLKLSLYSGESWSWITVPDVTGFDVTGVTSVAFAVDGKTACAAYCDPQQVTPNNDNGKLLWISFDDNDKYSVVSKPCKMTQVDMYTTMLLIGAVGTSVFMSADMGNTWIECVSQVKNEFDIEQVYASFWDELGEGEYDAIYNPAPYVHSVRFAVKRNQNTVYVDPVLAGTMVEVPVLLNLGFGESVSEFVYKGGLGTATAVSSGSLLIMNDGETNFGQTITCLGAGGDGRVYVGTGSYLFTQLVHNGPFYACRVSLPAGCDAWVDETRQALGDGCAMQWVAVSVQRDFVVAATYSRVYYSAGHDLLLQPEALPVLPGMDGGVWWQCVGSNASGTMLLGASNGDLYRCMNRTWVKLTPPVLPGNASWFKVVVGPTVMVAVSIKPSALVNYDGSYFEYTIYCSRDMGSTWIELYSNDADYGQSDPSGRRHTNAIQFRGDIYVSNDDLIMTTCEEDKKSAKLNQYPDNLIISVYNPKLIQYTVNQTYSLDSICTSRRVLYFDRDMISGYIKWKVIPSDDFSTLYYATQDFYPCFDNLCDSTQYCNNLTESCVLKTGWKPRITSIAAQQDAIIIQWTDDGRLYDTWWTYLGYDPNRNITSPQIPDAIYVKSRTTGKEKEFTDTFEITSFDRSVYLNRRQTGANSLDLTTVLPRAWISDLGTNLQLQIKVLGETSLPSVF